MVANMLSIQRERSLRATRSFKIMERYARNEKVKDIALEYDVTKSTVLRLARVAGLSKRPKHFPEKIRKAAITMIKSGKLYTEIKARLGVSEAYISKLAKEIGQSRYKNGR